MDVHFLKKVLRNCSFIALNVKGLPPSSTKKKMQKENGSGNSIGSLASNSSDVDTSEFEDNSDFSQDSDDNETSRNDEDSQVHFHIQLTDNDRFRVINPYIFARSLDIHFLRHHLSINSQLMEILNLLM